MINVINELLFDYQFISCMQNFNVICDIANLMLFDLIYLIAALAIIV